MHGRRYTAEQEAKLDRKGDDQSGEYSLIVLVFALGRPNGDQVDPILDAFPPRIEVLPPREPWRIGDATRGA